MKFNNYFIKKMQGLSKKITEIRDFLGFSRREFSKKLGSKLTTTQAIEIRKQKSNDIFIISVVSKLNVFHRLLIGEGKLFQEARSANSESANDQEIQSGNSITWLSVTTISALAQISKETIQKAVKRGMWQSHILTSREAVGWDGRRVEILPSSLPTGVQEIYWQSAGRDENEVKIQVQEEHHPFFS